MPFTSLTEALSTIVDCLTASFSSLTAA